MKGKIYDELSNGNFISTQGILLKNSHLQKFLFDINLPRLQDYDFILRIIPNAKVSFTKEVLVDIYIQKDSISHSLPKLERAVKLFASCILLPLNPLAIPSSVIVGLPTTVNLERSKVECA